MIRWIVGVSLRSRRIVIAFAAIIMVFGFLSFGDMPKDVLPEFTPPTVEVQTEALGLSAVEVEELITSPLEQDLLNGVAFLDTIRSRSIPGLSSIEMIFEPGTDILDARQVVAERLTQAHALPQVSKPPQMLQPLSSTSRVMMIGLSSEDMSAIDLSILARWTLRPRLLGVDGVANVAVWGQRERQLQVLVDPERLRANGVTLQQIIESTANAQFVSNLSFVEASTPGTGGIVETPNQRFGVRHAVPFATPDDLAKVIIDGAGSRALHLGDVADVVVDHQPLIGDAVLPEGVGLMLVIEKFPGASALDVTRGVEEALDAMRPGLSGVTIDPSLFRPATFIEQSHDNLVVALMIGAVLLVLALGALLFDWRTALVSLLAITASSLAAALVLSTFDTTLNVMTIAGLVLALVVVIDDAVGDVENAAERIRRRRETDGVSVPRAILDAALGMRSAAGYAAAISLVALVPVFFTGGAFGAFFPSVAVAYGVAILVSMAVALVITPALGALLLGRASGRRESPIVRSLRPRYERGVSRAIGSARPAIVLVGLALAAGLLAAPLLSTSMTPAFRDPNVLVRLEATPGTSLSEMDRVSSLVAGELRTVPGVLAVGGHAGRALVSDQVVGVNVSELSVTVDPDVDYDATVWTIDEVVRGYPGLARDVMTYPAERIGEVLGASSTDPVTVRIYGQDLSILAEKADEVKEILGGIEGVVDPQVETQTLEPTLEIEVDLAAAQGAGIVPGDVRRAAATVLSGIQVGSLFDEQKVFEVVVWGTPGTRHDLSQIEDLAIDTRGGGRVRLGDVADVTIAPSPNVIRHEAVSRSLDITAGVSGRDLSDVVGDLEERLGQVTFPLEYHAEVVGDFAEEQADNQQALGFAFLAAIAVLLLIQAAIGHWRLAVLVFLMLPLCLAGGVVAAAITGGGVSLGTVAGLFALLGVASRHAVTQIRHYQGLERREGLLHGPDLVLRGARERFTSVLTSVFATALVMVPFAVAGPIAGLEILQPMALVILGGFVTTMLLTLSWSRRCTCDSGLGRSPTCPSCWRSRWSISPISSEPSS